MASHYKGPGKGKESPKAKSKLRAKGSYKQPSGQPNKNAQGGPGDTGIQRMRF